MDEVIVNPELAGEPLVTVVMPVYNAEKYLRETLDSLFAQTFRDFEVIAVDDGSQDGSRDLLHQHPQPVRVLTHPGDTNKGQYASVNLAVMHSKAKYLAFLDADDLWSPEKLEKQVRFLEDRPHISLVYCNGYAVDSDGNQLYELFPRTHQEVSAPEEILLDCYIRTPSSVMVHRWAIQEAGWFDCSLVPGDHDLWIKLSESFEFGYLDEMLAHYRRHEGQLSTTRKLWEGGFPILANARTRFPYSRKTIRKRLAIINYRLGVFDLQQKKITAIPFLLRAFFYDPLRALKTLVIGLRSRLLGRPPRHTK